MATESTKEVPAGSTNQATAEMLHAAAAGNVIKFKYIRSSARTWIVY